MMSRRWRRRTIALMVSLFIINIPFCNYHSSFEQVWPAKVESAAVPAGEISLVQSITPLPLLSPLPASTIKPSEPQPSLKKPSRKIGEKNRVSNNKICRNLKKKINRPAPTHKSIAPKALEVAPEEQPAPMQEVEVALQVPKEEISQEEMDRINAKVKELNANCKKLVRKLAQGQKMYLKVMVIPTDDSIYLKVKRVVPVPSESAIPKI